MSRLPPVVAWKLASWRPDPSTGVAFSGLCGTGYRPVDESRCRYGCPPGAPQSEEHRCGFYGWRHRSRGLMPDTERVELRVALGGLVREYEHGYRGGLQRVLAVHIPPVCVGCEGIADGLITASLEPCCMGCAFRREQDLTSLAAVRQASGLEVWWLSSRLGSGDVI